MDRISVLRFVLGALIGFVLAVSPMQSMSIAGHVLETSIATSACDTDPCQCEKARPDCATSETCFLKCNKTPGLTDVTVSERPGIGGIPVSFVKDKLVSHRSTPLRRPPRA